MDLSHQYPWWLKYTIDAMYAKAAGSFVCLNKFEFKASSWKYHEQAIVTFALHIHLQDLTLKEKFTPKRKIQSLSTQFCADVTSGEVS